MPEYLHPGVYIEEIERGPKPIEGVPTSTAAFIGETERGSVKPKLLTSYKDYLRSFGGTFGDEKYMPYAVNGFFENGGKRMFVCRALRCERLL
jgi:phage tail sheath protein FI